MSLDQNTIAEAVRNAGTVAVDIETYGQGKNGGLDPWRGNIRVVTLAVPGRPPWLLDLKQTGGLSPALLTAISGATFVAHNAKFDLLWLAIKFGIRPKRIFCTMTASRLLTAGTNERNGLDSVLLRHLKVEPERDQSRSDWGGLFLTEEQRDYALGDVGHLHDLRQVLEKEIAGAGLAKVCRLEMDLIPVVLCMEEAGIDVDADQLGRLRDEAVSNAQEARGRLSDVLKTPSLNPNSTKQLVAALSRFGIRVGNTKEPTLANADDGKIIPLILSFREHEKLVQYATGLLEAIQSDGRIHSSFDPTGADTGRFSSKNPNLQSVPRGPMRSCFVAGQGKALVIADYSQIELRAVAAIAREENMLAAFARGEDLHRLTAAAILNKSPGDVTKEDRQVAKSANFGLIYGQTADGFAAYAKTKYGVSLTNSQATQIRTRFFDSYPGIARWHDECRCRAHDGTAEVRTMLGRRRLIPSSAVFWDRFTALVNAPVQGGCADVIKAAMVGLGTALPGCARLVSTVHDELIVECTADSADRVAKTLRQAMIDAMRGIFPEVKPDAEVITGSNWGAK